MFIHGPRLWLLAICIIFSIGAFADRQIFSFILLALALGVTFAVWRYDNRYEFEEVRKAKAKTAEQKRIQETPARVTLPTPEESRMAQAQLRVAWNIVHKAQREHVIDQALKDLEAAPRALSKVRELDPAATIDVQLDPKKPDLTRMTHDSVAAFMLYLQSKWLDIQVDNRFKLSLDAASDGNRSAAKSLSRETEELTQRSAAAIHQAVAYMPDHVPYLLHAAYHSNEPEHSQLIRKAVALEPYNVEALEMANRLK